MTDFDHILSWRLKHGSHEFPGPDGGTCINEAAIVAAGFPYCEVTCVNDLPSCFDPYIGNILITLNDRLDDEPRQLLLPLVTRLAGSRVDDYRIVRERLLMILRETGIVDYANLHDRIMHGPFYDLLDVSDLLAEVALSHVHAARVRDETIEVDYFKMAINPIEEMIRAVKRRSARNVKDETRAVEHVVDVIARALDHGRVAEAVPSGTAAERMRSKREEIAA